MRARVVTLVVVGLVASATAFVASPAGAQDAVYTIRVDAKTPAGQNWDFLRFFPGPDLQVHSGDVVHFAWRGSFAPHTATVVPEGDPGAWRGENQGSGDPYELIVLDTTAGGDDDETIINPAVVNPPVPACGTSAAPCTFNGTNVVNSGFVFSSPGSQPSFDVSIDAPEGEYSFVCLIHPGMEVGLSVVAGTETIPTPDEVTAAGKAQTRDARSEDGPAADRMSQRVRRLDIGGGDQRVVLNAGGFVNQVTANEFVGRAVRVHVGDQIRFRGMPEIHTVTFPASAIEDVPFIFTVCEQTGDDAPAQSPADCASPAAFHVVANPEALAPSASNLLRNPERFVSAGLFTSPAKGNFVARRAGVYTFICLVHEEAMSGTIRIV